MRAPDFWKTRNLTSTALLPVSWLYAMGQTAHRITTPVFPAPLPTICIGNATVGGAGKTPTVEAIIHFLKAEGRAPHIICRGYGGTEEGPLQVDPARHTAAEVGDEALLHAAYAPTWVAHDRMAGLHAACKADADCAVMDDGLQHYGVRPSASLLVVNGRYGFGNRRLLPAGPLREPVREILKHVHGVVLIGEDERSITRRLPAALPLFTASILPDPEIAAALAGKPVLGFAGIGQPEKFKQTLEQCGARCEAFYSFPDHHAYQDAKVEQMLVEAERNGWSVVTTSKDAVKLPPSLKERLITLPITVHFSDPLAISAFLTHRLI